MHTLPPTSDQVWRKMTDKSIWTGIRRGLACRCPNCGQGRLFDDFLRVRKVCDQCGADNSVYPSDDFPPYLTIFLVGHVVVPAFIWSDLRFAPSLWLQGAIWLPLTALLCVALLPMMKGATSGLCWAVGLVRSESPMPRAATHVGRLT
jgi:uncharacterized protein (DUF983 family)